MGIEYLQSNLTGGALAETLHARVDIEKYNTSVATAENVVIVPQGGLRRRPGLQKLDDGKIASEAKMFPFVFSKTQQYLLVFRASNIDIFRDDTLVHTITSSPYTTLTVIKEIDVIQSADTVIITHGDFQPYSLVRGASDTDWTLAAISLTIPTYDFGSGAEPVWSATRGWPRACTFHMNRLWFAGSAQKPTSVWGSRVDGYFDFTAVDSGSGIPDDHAIFDTLELGVYNKIVSIFSARGLQVFTTGGEFYNSVDIITPNNSAWVPQTPYGSAEGIRPLFIDGATLFVDSSGKNIREFVFSFQEDSHVSNSITLLASHLLTDIQSIASIKGTSLDISDYVYVVNSDGTIAVMNTLRSEGILGWTHWTTDGEFLDVCVVDKDAYFLVKREGAYFVEKLDEDSYTDHSVVISGTKPTTYNVVHSGYDVVYNLDPVVHTDTASGSPISSITTNYDATFDNVIFDVIADYSIMPTTTPTVTAPGANTFSIPRNAYRLEVGLNYKTNITTLPLAQGLKTGSTLHRRKRVVKVDVNYYESLGVYAQDIFGSDRTFPITLDDALTLQTGFKEIYTLGYDRILQIAITQRDPLPMLIRAIGYEVEY